MLTIEILAVVLVVVALGTAAWRFPGKRFFSAEAVDRRRRDRSNRRVVSRRQGPAIKLASRVRRT